MKMNVDFEYIITVKGDAEWESKIDLMKELMERIDSAVHQVIDDDFLGLEAEVRVDSFYSFEK